MTTSPAPGLAPVREQLANGVTLLVKEARAQPAVAINATMTAGSVCDPPGAEGLTHFLSRLLDRGAGTRSAEEVADTLDLRGVSPLISVTRYATTLSCDCLADDFETVLETVCDMLRAPRCSEAEVDTRRGQLLTELRQDEDSPATRAIEAVMPLLYGQDHPYGRRPRGTAATVEGIDRRQLLDHQAAWFAPDRLTLVLVGDIRVSAAVAALARVCGGWENLAQPAPQLAPPPGQTRQRVVIPMPAKAQVDIVYGFTTILRSDPAFHAHWIMNNVLGQYGIGGRVGRSIRERQGMAYYAGSMFEAGHIAGPLLVRAGVNADNVDRAVASIDTEVSAMARDGVTEDELTSAKRYLVGSIPRSLETNEGIARFLQTAEQFDLGLDYDRRLPGLVQAVTTDDVGEAARRTLVTERASIVIAGPYEAT